MRQHVSPHQSLSSYRPPAGAGSATSGAAAGDDILIASVFRNMRATLGVTQAELAARLATSVHVVAALEAGAIRQLPAWPEMERIVAGYGHLLQLDVQPAVTRLHFSMRRLGSTAPASASVPAAPKAPWPAPGLASTSPVPAAAPVTPPVMRAAPQVPPRPPVQHLADVYSRVASHPAPAVVPAAEPDPEPVSLYGRIVEKLGALRAVAPRLAFARGRDLRRAGIALAIAAVVMGMGMAAIAAMPARLTAKLESLSPAVAQTVRSSLGRWTTRTEAGDLQWVEVADPRTRKADKLPVVQR